MTRLVLALVALMLAAPAGAADIKPFGRGSWESLRAAHAGRPLIVHLWSLTCAPCLAELPNWTSLKRAYPHMNIVLVATDPMEQAPRLTSTLARAGLGQIESWAFADPFTERLRFEIDRRWRGELPRTLLIAVDGSTEAISGVVDGDTVTRWLKRQEVPHAARP